MKNKTKNFLGLIAGTLLLAGCQASAASGEDVQVLGASRSHNPVAATEKTTLTMDDAKQIAFDHAGVNGTDASFDDEEFDRDDNLYELEFHVEGVEYEYDIHAESGKILEAERDEDDKKRKEKSNTEKKNTTQPTKDAVISMDEAKQIAFDHAGVDGADTLFDDQEFDRDDNLYELEFHVDGIEYEYDIDAETGNVLEAERDEDDYKKGTPKKAKADTSKEPKQQAKKDTKKSSNNDTITKEKAVQIALDHAGVSKSEVDFDDIELGHDDGKKVFEIEFDSNTHEYEYDIDAHSGNILDHEIEQDD